MTSTSSITEDPSPSLADLGIKEKGNKEKSKESAPLIAENHIPNPAPIELGARPSPEVQLAAGKMQARYDTILQFAAIELEGTIQKHHLKG